MKKFLLFVLAAFAFAACEQAPIEEQSAICTDAPETITVGFEDDETRIQLNEAQKTVWTKDDLVSVFYRSDANQKWQYQGETGERVGDLKRVDASTASKNINRVVVIYPYNENYYINPETYNVQASLPAVQSYQEDSYGVDSNIMISQSEYNQFSLKSVCGWLKLQLTGNGEVVKSIKFRGNDDEQVAGELYINSADATIALASDMGSAENNNAGGNLVFDDTILTEVVLDCGEGVTLGPEATSFYITLPPQNFVGGFTVEIEDCEGYIMEKSTDNAITIERNIILPMQTVEFNRIPNNEIHYTATAKLELREYDRYNDPIIWDSEILSHTFNEETGYGIITFKEDVTTIHKWAFWGQDTMTSITLPNSVSSIEEVAFNCENIEMFYGKHSAEDGSYISIDDRFIAFAPKHHSTECIIPDNIRIIERAAFWECYNLNSVQIPDNVTTIGADAFTYCDNLQQITIPENVTSIGWGAFYCCYNLQEVYCKATTPPSIVTEYSWYAFGGNASDRKIYVPTNSVEAYKNAAGWKNYANAIHEFPYTPTECTSLTITADDVVGNATSTTIYYTAVTNGVDYNGVFKSETIIGTAQSNSFPQNASTTESVEHTITFSYLGQTATTTIIQGPYVDPYYTISLNDEWRLSESLLNPDSSLYDGVYESYSNYNVNNSVATMYIDITGYSEFSIYVRSNAESSYDYVTVSELDSVSEKVSTLGNQNSGTEISNYTKVTYTGIDGGSHRIIITYRKDYSYHYGTDRGYLIIQKNQ